MQGPPEQTKRLWKKAQLEDSHFLISKFATKPIVIHCGNGIREDIQINITKMRIQK